MSTQGQERMNIRQLPTGVPGLDEPLRGYRALTSGIPEPWSTESGQRDPEPRPERAPDESSPPPQASSPAPKKSRRRSGQ
jgi:hypothetical protein